ncbi:MAG: putative GNAT family acetyltransferase [Polyangiales bacterium]|jgi:predicted GNAT family acetyltransferase
MSESLRVEQQDGASGGRLLLMTPDGKALGKLEYRWVEGVMHIDHAEVAAPLRGKGLAQTLVLDAVSRARAEGFQIKPHCSYVVGIFQKWGDKTADVLV